MTSESLVELLQRMDRATHELHVVSRAIRAGTPVDAKRLDSVLAELRAIKSRLRRTTTSG